ncbi:uncharacterized protein [Rhodnius prolixus]|uniref:ANK_REP_REGION domain-containing protein n=1 Tax=Rhodnius prolixus TaxID=13249 RepID=T1HCD1_RHOPR
MALPEGYFSDSDSEDECLTFPDDDFAKDKKKIFEIDLLPGQKMINAILDRNIEVVVQLLEDGVDANYSDNSGWTPLMYASSLGVAELVDILLKNGASPNFHYKLTTPLICLCESTSFDDDGLIKSFNLLIDSGANINICDENRMTPLMHATARGHMKLVARLIELGADLEVSDNDGWSAIFYGVNSGDVHMVQMLKDAGCDLKLIDVMGRSLHNLASAKNFGVIDEIVSDEKKKDFQQQLFNNEKMSNYQLIMFDLPNYNNSDFDGFSEDTIKTIFAIGLSNLVSLFMEKKIGYGQFLTFDEEQWKSIGVEMSFDRKKLTSSANRIIQKKWSQDAFLKKEDCEFSMLKLIQCLSNNVRIIHVLISTFFACKRELSIPDNRASVKLKVLLNHCLVEMKLLSIQVRKMENLIGNLHQIPPADFIERKC